MKAALTLRGAIQDQGIRHMYGRFDATAGVIVGSWMPDHGDGKYGDILAPGSGLGKWCDIGMKSI